MCSIIAFPEIRYMKEITNSNTIDSLTLLSVWVKLTFRNYFYSLINFACKLKKLIYSAGLFPPTWNFISNKNLIK